MLEEIWAAAQEEMDFVIEAAHLEEHAKLNQAAIYVTCPKAEKHLDRLGHSGTSVPAEQRVISNGDESHCGWPCPRAEQRGSTRSCTK